MSMQFQQRDGEILGWIYANDGVMAKRQLKLLFWPNKSWRAMERRLSKLFHNAYIAWPNREHQHTQPIPEPICWLGWRGALYIAGKCGAVVQPPKSENENQLRLFQKRLRDCGIRWFREPRWSLLRHDLAAVDFRLALERSVGQLPSLVMDKWLPESSFRADMDRVSYAVKARDGGIVRMERGVCPDGYFEIIDEARRMVRQPHRARFLLEIDMGTHDNPSFGREKAAPGAVYIQSAAYKSRFGCNSGRWLVVTGSGERRMRNLMQQTEEQVGQDAQLFFFALLDQISVGNILIDPIWRQVGRSEPVRLLS